MAVEGVFTGNAVADQVQRQRSTAPVKRALVAGVVGRMGESLLNVLLARGGYAEVIALAERPMNLGISKLSVSPLQGLPEIDDLFMILGSDDFSMQRSFHGRDAPFISVEAGNAHQIASVACARRITLISSSPAWQQFGPLNQGLTSPLERDLAALKSSRLVVLRPVRQSASAGLGLIQRFVNVYLSIQMLMMPRSVPTLTTEQVARAAVTILADQDAHGVSVFGAADLAAALAPPPRSNASG